MPICIIDAFKVIHVTDGNTERRFVLRVLLTDMFQELFSASSVVQASQKILLHQYFDKEAVTKGGHHVEVCANIGSVKDAEEAKKGRGGRRGAVPQ